MTAMTERVSKLIGFGRIAAEEVDPEIKDLHYQRMEGWDEVDHAYDSLVTRLGDALNRAFFLAETLVLHKAVHGTGAMFSDPLEEWKRLAILLEQRTADTDASQLASMLNRLLEEDR